MADRTDVGGGEPIVVNNTPVGRPYVPTDHVPHPDDMSVTSGDAANLDAGPIEPATDPDATQLMDAADLPADDMPDIFVSPDEEPFADDPFVSAIPPADAAQADATVIAPVAATPLVKKKSRGAHAAIVAAVSVVGVIALLFGAGVVGTAYFNTHAKPGAELAGRNITGFSSAQVRDLAVTLMDNYMATLSLNGRQIEATAQQLGVNFDLEETVLDAMNAGSSATTTSKYNPFHTKNVPLAIQVDQDTLQDFLNSSFITDDQRPVPASVDYDADQAQFVIVPSQGGTRADVASVTASLSKGEGFGSVLVVPTTSDESVVTDEIAQQIADKANNLLATPYVLTAGDESYTIPATSIASWLLFAPNVDKGTVDMSVDAAKVTAELPEMMTENLTEAAVPQQILVGPDGHALAVQQKGSAGTSVADPAAATDTVVQALVAGTGIDLSVETVTQPFTTENVNMDPEYLVPHGEKWVEVNRSNFTMTRWEGTTKLSTWSIIIGRPATPTYTGVFHVYLMLKSQTMRGDDYVQPDVPWIAYFNGDIALHGNYWIPTFGQAASHGCVGIPVDLAEVNWNWIDMGTLVVVHD